MTVDRKRNRRRRRQSRITKVQQRRYLRHTHLMRSVGPARGAGTHDASLGRSKGQTGKRIRAIVPPRELTNKSRRVLGKLKKICRKSDQFRCASARRESADVKPRSHPCTWPIPTRAPAFQSPPSANPCMEDAPDGACILPADLAHVRLAAIDGKRDESRHLRSCAGAFHATERC